MAFRKRQNAALANKPQVTGRHCHHRPRPPPLPLPPQVHHAISTSTSSALPAAGARPLRPRAAHRLPSSRGASCARASARCPTRRHCHPPPPRLDDHHRHHRPPLRLHLHLDLHLSLQVSDALSTIGLPLGGSEDWADRLYIVTKGGALLFDDDELDMAEEAQKRMEVHTRWDAPRTRADSRAHGRACRILLTHRSSSARYTGDVQRRRVVGELETRIGELAPPQPADQPRPPEHVARRRRRSRALARLGRSQVPPRDLRRADVEVILARSHRAPHTAAATSHPTSYATRFPQVILGAHRAARAAERAPRRAARAAPERRRAASPCSSAASTRWRRRARRRSSSRCARPAGASASSSTPRRCGRS